MKLKQKCAVITGGANGIGRAVAELFVAEGARIAILDCDRRNGEAAAAALNGRALFLPCDVSDSRQADEALQTAVSHLGTIDILINDAASQLNKPLLETSDEEFRKVLDINLTATFHFTREAAKLGDDVVVGSLSGDLPFAQKRFCAAEGIDRVHVFSDYKELDFGMKYGFVIDSLRLLARGVVVVDRDDVVRYVEYVPEVTREPDYEKALAVARELAK